MRTLVCASGIVALWLAVIATVAPAAPDEDGKPPRIGAAAPPLSIEKTFGRAKGIPQAEWLSWEQLRGRVVVLDFSASWCGPCIAMLPHMNELVRALDSEPVTFLLVTNESEKDIESLRKDHEIGAVVCRDVDGSTFENYWVNGIPHVAVVDREGRLAALTHPEHLTESALRDLLAGRAIDLPRTNENPTRRRWDVRPPEERGDDASGDANVLARAEISRGELQGVSRVDPETGRITCSGIPFRPLLFTAWDMSPETLDVKVEVDERKYYDVSIIPADGNVETARRMMQDLLAATFSFEAGFESREVPVKLLRRVEGATPLETSTAPRSNLRALGGLFELTNLTMDTFAKTLRMHAGMTVVDDTGLEGGYDVRVSWDLRKGRDAFHASLREAGFELVDGKRPVDFLVVRPKL